jgi:formylglycine-generating enzyme required for sulfatase activity
MRRVGAYPTNKLGLCDTHGNVLEWCADLDAPDRAGRVLRVIRGGKWWDRGVRCRAASRVGLTPSYRECDIGFRLARVRVR